MRPFRRFGTCGLILSAIWPGYPRLAAQSLRATALVTLYGDNTEFFTPFREGETLFGGQFKAMLEARPGEHSTILAGVFGDRRWGSDGFLDEVKPILSFRWRKGTSEGILGTLRTERRHGLLDPLSVATRELTRPVEYGGQWIERRRAWDAEAFLDWTALNTAEQREAFHYGVIARLRPQRLLTLEAQLHGLHRGGQLFNADVPVTNNVASALGVRLADTLGVLGHSEVAVFRFQSHGNIEPDAPPRRPDHGRGTYLRVATMPAGWAEVFAIWWMGHDFLAQDGDPNYGSIGVDPDFYRGRRRYFELGFARRIETEGRVTFDGEFRLHRIDDDRSEALFDSKWEYSYRLVVRAPIEILIR